MNRIYKSKVIIALVAIMIACSILMTGCGDAGSAGSSAEAPASFAGLADGSYHIDMTMEGGTGKAFIESPVAIEVSDGYATATFVWSSKNYDYMLVDNVKYDNEAAEGEPSVFTVSLGKVENLDSPITIIGDTVAMSTPHEIEYTLYFEL